MSEQKPTSPSAGAAPDLSAESPAAAPDAAHSPQWGPQGTGRFGAGARAGFGQADAAADYRSVQQGQGGGLSSASASASASAGEAQASATTTGGWNTSAIPESSFAEGDAALQAGLMDELNALRAELDAVRRESDGHREAWLRAQAETENVRRRSQDEVAKAHKFGIESFAESLVPVMDSLEMALRVETATAQQLREGVEATLRQLVQSFEKNRLKAIDPLHQKFDPNQHQAISMAPSAEVPAQHVAQVLQKGYSLNDRVLRPALVVVSQGGAG